MTASPYREESAPAPTTEALFEARARAQKAFDTLWHMPGGYMARKHAVAFVQKRMRITHLAIRTSFSVAQCEQLCIIVANYVTFRRRRDQRRAQRGVQA